VLLLGSAILALSRARNAEPKNAALCILTPEYKIPFYRKISPIPHAQTMNTRLFTLLVAATLTAGATAAFAAPAAENWENHCTKCHGDDGKGQTKAGKKLQLKDYSDAAVQEKMKDDEMAKTIADGVFEKGKEKMKSFKDELSSDEIKDLVAYIRKLKT
jgi:cytochrome c6